MESFIKYFRVRILIKMNTSLKMRTNKLMVAFVAIFVAIFAISTVLAGTIDIASMTVAVDDINGGVVVSPGDTVPVEVRFNSNDNLDDAKIRVWISGYKDDIEDSSGRFDVISGKNYVKRFAIELPGINDLDDMDAEDLTLHVEIADKNDDYEAEYDITVQRESYTYGLLSVEAPSEANAGDIVAIDVVLKNIGSNELEDSFVTARITELGIYKKVYFGDIAPEDNFNGDDDSEDARERRIYLVIPTDAISGDYNIEVKASNYDANVEVVESISIDGITAEDSVVDATKDNEGIPNSVIVLTVVLVIVFVVLLIVLIVLLTKKPAERIEDFGETSYY